MHRLHRTTFHQRLRLPLKVAKPLEVKGAALSCRPNTPQHAASHPFPSVVEELRPFAVWRTLNVSSFGS